MRRIEERLVYPLDDGTELVVGEWEESDRRKHPPVRDAEARAVVRELNAKARREGCYLRYRSVEIEGL